MATTDLAEPVPTEAHLDAEQASTREIDVVARELQVDLTTGLTESEASQRLERFGPNLLREVRAASAWSIFIAQFLTPVVGLLGLAAAVSFSFQEWLEGFAILAVLVISTLLGFVAELKGTRSVEALRKLGTRTTRVRREGTVHEVPAQDLVPGDIVLFEGGDLVAADLRIAKASRLQADESTLTGESLPVDKSPEATKEGTVLAERTGMLFKGTSVTRGSAEAVVVATGQATELGRIAELVDEAEGESTPLEKRLEGLTRKLILLTLIVAAVTTGLGILSGKGWLLMVETGIALAVAAIPEGLPIVATIALARGMWRMARRHALINRLAAVETLGATSVIFTDKTGTLTENRMTVERIVTPDGEWERDRSTESLSPRVREAFELIQLCNNAETDGAGDPLEVALARAAEKVLGRGRAAAESEQPRAREEAFDSVTKMMAVVINSKEGFRYLIKGAPEAVLEACSTEAGAEGVRPWTDERRAHWHARDEQIAAGGGRLLGLAQKTAASAEDAPYENLTWLGLVSLHDPPRKDVPDAIRACQDAGIQVIMVTGDQPGTARSIALAVGLVDDPNARVLGAKDLERLIAEDRDEELRSSSIHARVTPEQKLELVSRFQKSGAVVAMTGDGVNDAPALKKADIGVAMGQRGTQVAREAADMVLTDDAFGSIVAAIRQGRIIFDNIRSFVIYLLACNLSEILLVGTASMLPIPLPITPIQILFLNLVTDVFPALAFAMGEGDPRVMGRPPRDSSEPIIARRHWRRIAFYGAALTVSVLLALILAHSALGRTREQSVTVSFLTLAIGQLFLVLILRDQDASLFRNAITKNAWMGGAIALCLVLLLAAVFVPFLARVLATTPPAPLDWLLILLAAVLPVVIDLVVRAFRKRAKLSLEPGV
ncbi:MAG: cation-transporting P-type ATPase [Planctomycetota bacterium]